MDAAAMPAPSLPVSHARPRLLLALCATLSLWQGALAQDTDAAIGFADSSLDAWKERVFEGNTEYTLTEKDGVAALQARTDGAASVLYREQKIDLTETPIIEWHWQTDTLYQGLDQQQKSGDDFPARLYVVARFGALPWDVKSLNYVWTSSIEEGTVWPNPFTAKAAMIAVQSGPNELGEWVMERRNIVEDFRAAFGKDVKAIIGYAVMADGDNADQTATSWFGNIRFVAE